jgi:hypothetical protein
MFTQARQLPGYVFGGVVKQRCFADSQFPG